MKTFAAAVEKIDAGDEGTPQPEGGEYETFLGADDMWLDRSRPAAELHRLAWAWRYTIAVDGMRGATRLDCGDGPLWLVKTEPVPQPGPEPGRR